MPDGQNAAIHGDPELADGLVAQLGGLSLGSVHQGRVFPQREKLGGVVNGHGVLLQGAANLGGPAVAGNSVALKSVLHPPQNHRP
jgi:hypothetical protein